MTSRAELAAVRPAKKAVLRMALLAGAAVVALAQPVAAESLSEAMALAYQSNPNLQAARARLRATDENVPLALSGWRPTLSVNGTASRARSENTIFSGGGVGQVVTGGTTLRSSQNIAAQFTQPLFRGFRTAAGTAQAKNQVYAERARLQQTEAQVLLQVATAYLDVLQNQAVVEQSMNNVQVLSRQLEATQDRFRVGEITRTDVAQSQASLAAARASLVLAEGALQQARSAYENVVGKPPVGLEQPPIPAILPANLEAAVAAAIAENPNYLANDFSAKAAEENVTLVQGELLPSVNLIAQYSRGFNTVADKSRSENAQAQAQVQIPLYQQGAEYARLRQAKQIADQQKLLADQARLDARNVVTTAWESYQSTTASITSFQALIAANEIALEGVQREAEVGSRTVLDVLNAEQNLLNSRISLIRAQRDQAVAAHQVLAAIGTLSSDDLRLDAPLYDPTDHYNDVEFKAFGVGSRSETTNK